MIIDNRDGKSLEGTVCENEDLIVIAKRGSRVDLSNSKLGKGVLVLCKNKYSFTVAASVLIDSDELKPFSGSDKEYLNKYACHIMLDIQNSNIGFNKNNLRKHIEQIKHQGHPCVDVENGIELK